MPNDSGKMADVEWLSWSCILFVLVCLLQQCSFQLIVNVRTKEGSVVQQTFNSDPVKDFVSIDFKLDEERFVTVYLDFRKKRKIFQVIVLGEIDKAESSYESICFVTELGEGEFIPSDAMSKLRQKNPSTIRVPEEDIATDSLLTDHAVTLDTAYVTDKDINHLCKDSGQVLFRESDLKLLLPENSTRENLGNLKLASEDHSSLLKQSKRCKDTPELNRECMCRVQICISWYPCQLKYCQGQDLDGQFTEYRCGIKTCGKCHNFNFFVRERRHCFWDVNSPS